MKIARVMLSSLGGGLPRPCQRLQSVRFLSTENAFGGNIPNSDSFESADEFEGRIFGGFSGDSPKAQSFYGKIDRIERNRFRFDPSTGNGDSSRRDVLDESFSSLSDGMNGKLKKAAATYFEFDPDEIQRDDYSFRPDVTFLSGRTYEPKDLDLRRPGVRKPPKSYTFEVTTEEVLRKADFRNVKFLAKFLTEAGIIIKRSSTGISAKAQRKVAREIKTARAFGLMPFITMGTKSFVAGRSMEVMDKDYEYQAFDSDMISDEKPEI
ncbi:30S ribosomal protein S18 [Hibiscus syriacus]|uniref:Small ribosomal subunit protein bS18c n=1 Tax=Hibiscus syriacus TaxID=106335 RepID=A0A6A2YKJ9_HIBSY|nr:30S ribosomal protein S18 [Hibiscus syriacus]KAE8678897.1 30S ribosomal protein S18 [Hibiscus syriacus]